MKEKNSEIHDCYVALFVGFDTVNSATEFRIAIFNKGCFHFFIYDPW